VAASGPYRSRQVGRDDPGELGGAGTQVGPAHDLGDQPDLAGPRRRHPLVETQERHPQHLAERNPPRQPDRERRGQPVADVRVEERRVVGADDDVRLVHPVERAPGHHAVQRGDDIK
jgi:hypothetical protein